MRNKNTLFLQLLIVSLLYSCNNDISYPELKCDQVNLNVNQTVQKVKSATTAVATIYPYDDIIEAYVVSSDEGGNFFKTISFQTLATETIPATGFSISLDASNTYIDYRLGNKVFIKLKNQFTDIYYGAMRIGSLYETNFGTGSVGRLSQNDYKQILYATCKTISEEQLVDKITIADALNENRINTLVELTEVQFTELAIGRHYFEEANNIGGATNWNLRDKTGNQILFRTSSYANFATKIVPEGSGKVRGIVTKYGSDYQLLSRSENDVMLNQARNTPFFSEDFQSVTDNSTLNLAGWTNIVEKGSLYWKGVVSSGNGFAEYAITGTKVVSNIGWLISPRINMDEYTNEILTFRTAQDHLDVNSNLNSLEVLVSSNFDGLDFTKATWTTLAAKLPTQETPWNEFIGSGAIDLSAYTGTINIAFKYTGSGKDLALDGTFQIDDIQIFGEK